MQTRTTQADAEPGVGTASTAARSAQPALSASPPGRGMGWRGQGANRTYMEAKSTYRWQCPEEPMQVRLACPQWRSRRGCCRRRCSRGRGAALLRMQAPGPAPAWVSRHASIGGRIWANGAGFRTLLSLLLSGGGLLRQARGLLQLLMSIDCRHVGECQWQQRRLHHGVEARIKDRRLQSASVVVVSVMLSARSAQSRTI